MERNSKHFCDILRHRTKNFWPTVSHITMYMFTSHWHRTQDGRFRKMTAFMPQFFLSIITTEFLTTCGLFYAFSGQLIATIFHCLHYQQKKYLANKWLFNII